MPWGGPEMGKNHKNDFHELASNLMVHERFNRTGPAPIFNSFIVLCVQSKKSENT